MKPLLFCAFLLLSTTLLAQTTYKIYRTSDQLVINDGTTKASYPASTILMRGVDGIVEIYQNGKLIGFYNVSKIQDKTGNLYGGDASTTLDNILASLSSTGSSGTAASTASFGTAPVNSFTFDNQTSGTISTTGIIYMLVKNVGSGPATISYAGASYTLAAGDSESFTARLDQTANKYAPFASASPFTINATGTKVILYKTPTQ